MNQNAIILAAGKGSRMKSETIKVLHDVAGKPMLHHIIDTIQSLGITQIYIVVGHQAEAVKASLSDYDHLQFVDQKTQSGTGDAVRCCRSAINLTTPSQTVVLAGDCPLIRADTINKLCQTHHHQNAIATILTTTMDQPANYGRILRSNVGKVTGIKEAGDCTPEQRLINEINTGIYVFNTSLLFNTLARLEPINRQNEYYLTDVIHLLDQHNQNIAALKTPYFEDVIGINSRKELAQANRYAYQRHADSHMDNGVTILDPTTTFIDANVCIGADTIIQPFTILKGHTVIGQHCQLDPYTYLVNATIPDNTHVRYQRHRDAY